MAETVQPEKTLKKLPVYKAALDLDVQYCRSTQKAPRDVKYSHIIPLHCKVIEIATAIAFANEATPEERARFIRGAAKDIQDMKVRVRVLCDLHYITKKGFTAIAAAEENVARQLAGWLKSTEEKINELELNP